MIALLFICSLCSNGMTIERWDGHDLLRILKKGKRELLFFATTTLCMFPFWPVAVAPLSLTSPLALQVVFVAIAAATLVAVAIDVAVRAVSLSLTRVELLAFIDSIGTVLFTVEVGAATVRTFVVDEIGVIWGCLGGLVRESGGRVLSRVVSPADVLLLSRLLLTMSRWAVLVESSEWLTLLLKCDQPCTRTLEDAAGSRNIIDLNRPTPPPPPTPLPPPPPAPPLPLAPIVARPTKSPPPFSNDDDDSDGECGAGQRRLLLVVLYAPAEFINAGCLANWIKSRKRAWMVS